MERFSKKQSGVLVANGSGFLWKVEKYVGAAR